MKPWYLIQFNMLCSPQPLRCKLYRGYKYYNCILVNRICLSRLSEEGTCHTLSMNKILVFFTKLLS